MAFYGVNGKLANKVTYDMNQLPLIQLISYSFSMWFGMYLLARHHQKAGMRYAGLGLMAYAVGLGVDMLMAQLDNPALIEQIVWFRRVWIIVPALCWLGAVRQLIPHELRAELPRRPVALIFLASIFFALSVIIIILPQNVLGTDLVLLGISVDIILLGYGISALDAFEEGEAFLPDFLRAFISGILIALVFGGQIGLYIVLSNNFSLSALLLLMTLITTALALQAFSDAVQQSLDRVIFGTHHAAVERAELRAISSAIPRLDNSLDIQTISEKEFIRLTRRALSNMGNLSKLASSPLTRLPIITQRLQEKAQADNTLDRANELKLILSESIERLKPLDSGDFGTTDEWRFYNALYYPYVMGIKPFSHRNLLDENSMLKEVLDWFQTYVPERTLHNWQSAGAKLIAQDLREQVYTIAPLSTEMAYSQGN